MRLIETSTQAFILVKFNHQGDAMSGGSLVQYMSTHGKYPNVFYPMDKGKEKGSFVESSSSLPLPFNDVHECFLQVSRQKQALSILDQLTIWHR